VPDFDPVRFYLIGKIDRSKDKQTFTTFAEWDRARGLAHLQLGKANLDEIIAQIAEFKGVAEGGVEGFGQDALTILGEQLFNIVINGQARDLFQRATAVARDRRMSAPTSGNHSRGLRNRRLALGISLRWRGRMFHFSGIPSYFP